METIKYSDCTTGYIYSPNGSIRADWDADKDYGNEYARVHFRIKAKGYDYPGFSFSKEDRDAFDKDVKDVFTSLGWTCESKAYNGCCSIWFHGKSHLYMHPQDFSGEILKNEIKTVAEAIANSRTLKLLRADVYETAYDMTDEEYEMLLATKDEEIIEALTEACKTTRTYNYYDACTVAVSLAAKFRVARVGDSDGKNGGSGKTAKHILTIMEKMVKNGQLITAKINNQLLVRTPNKTEQRKRKTAS